MVNACSWLYGASQGQECPGCGDLVPNPTFGDPDPMAAHRRWWCDGPAKSTAGVLWLEPLVLGPEL